MKSFWSLLKRNAPDHLSPTRTRPHSRAGHNRDQSAPTIIATVVGLAVLLGVLVYGDGDQPSPTAERHHRERAASVCRATSVANVRATVSQSFNSSVVGASSYGWWWQVRLRFDHATDVTPGRSSPSVR